MAVLYDITWQETPLNEADNHPSHSVWFHPLIKSTSITYIRVYRGGNTDRYYYIPVLYYVSSLNVLLSHFTRGTKYMYLDRVKIQVYTQLVGQMFNAGVDFG